MGKQFRPPYELGGALIGRGGPVIGCGRIEYAERCREVDQVGTSVRQPRVEAVDMLLKLGLFRAKRGQDERFGHGP